MAVAMTNSASIFALESGLFCFCLFPMYNNNDNNNNNNNRSKIAIHFWTFRFALFFGKLPFFCFRAAIFHFYAAAAAAAAATATTSSATASSAGKTSWLRAAVQID